MIGPTRPHRTPCEVKVEGEPGDFFRVRPAVDTVSVAYEAAAKSRASSYVNKFPRYRPFTSARSICGWVRVCVRVCVYLRKRNQYKETSGRWVRVEQVVW